MRVPGKVIINKHTKEFSGIDFIDTVLSIFILGSMQGFELCLFLKIIKLVLVTFRDSLFSLNQLKIKIKYILSISIFNNFLNLSQT